MIRQRNLIAMIGTRFDTMGGISSVINVYKSAGLFDRWPITYIPTHCDGSKLDKIGIFFKAFWRFTGLLLTGRICLLHIHVSSRTSFWRKMLFILPAFILKIPTILHLHSGGFAHFYENECGSIAKFLVRLIFNKVSRIVVLSPTWAKWTSSMFSNPNILPIFNPVLMPTQPIFWNTRKHGTMLSLGRLGKNKGTYDLLEAIQDLSVQYPSLHAQLGGDGEVDKVMARAEELGVSNRVELLGWVRGQDKEHCLASAMVYVLPSYNEGLPMSVLEAMAAGLPVLTTPVGGIPEAVTDGVEGFLVEPGDVSAIADRLNRLLSEPGLAERMGAAARRKIETTFSAETILPQLEQLYTELGAA